VHLTEWPKADRKLIDAKLEERMTATSQAVEALQAARQEKGIKLRWPLDFAELPELGKVIPEVVKELGNVIELKEGRALKLGRPDMESALVRELTRRVQSMRKEKGMRFHEAIELELDTDGKTQTRLRAMEKQMAAGVGAKAVRFSKISKPAGSLDFEGARISISFRKA